ncbi:hypothetical protein BDZ91DRAFT_796662 [Kalaharituber pfeilii]|nr:hypothetical protein BDZ91DRAFT_796662 [Kalaharituber pfeilii]
MEGRRYDRGPEETQSNVHREVMNSHQLHHQQSIQERTTAPSGRGDGGGMTGEGGSVTGGSSRSGIMQKAGSGIDISDSSFKGRGEPVEVLGAELGGEHDTLSNSSVSGPPFLSSTSPAIFSSGTKSASGSLAARHDTPSSGGGVAALSQHFKDNKRSRACESCRGLKVRCEPADEANPFSSCKRCAKTGRECIFIAPRRKRQKKTDTKVAELERKIDALTASVLSVKEKAPQPPAPSSARDEDGNHKEAAQKAERHQVDSQQARGSSIQWGSSIPDLVAASRSHDSGKFVDGRPMLKRHRNDDEDRSEGEENSYARHGSLAVAASLGNTEKTVAAPSHDLPRGRFTIPTNPLLKQNHPEEVYQDVVDRGLLSMDVAAQLFNRYVNEMAPLFPGVVFSPHTTALQIRTTQPTLFLSILAIASGTSGSALHSELNKEAIRLLADRVICKGEKSLELIQSLVLNSVWQYPPNNNEEPKLYQLVHMAAVMAMDMGICSPNGHLRQQGGGLGTMDTTVGPKLYRSVASVSSGNGAQSGTAWREHAVRNDKRVYMDSSAIESRRTLLAVYWCCATVALSLRRQGIFRFTTYMAECIEVLETSKDALPSDRILAQWCKVQKIAEEIGVTFSFDDPGANVSINDPRIQFALRGFLRQLDLFCASAEPYFKQGVMGKSLQMSYLIAVLIAHEIALHVDHNVEDFGPPHTEKMIRGPSIGPTAQLTSFHIDILSRCLVNAYSMLDNFLSLGVEHMRALPAFHFVRVIYVAIILMKIFCTASAPKSELGLILDKDSLNVDTYIDALLRKLEEAAKGDKCRPAVKFGMILMLLKNWWGEWFEKDKGDTGSTNKAGVEPHASDLSGAEAGLKTPPGRELGTRPQWRNLQGTANETTCSPDLLFVRSAPQRFRANESPSSPPYTSSPAPRLLAEPGSCDSGSSNTQTSALQQRHSLPSSLPHPYSPSTPLQLLSDVASGGAAIVAPAKELSVVPSNPPGHPRIPAPVSLQLYPVSHPQHQQNRQPLQQQRSQSIDEGIRSPPLHSRHPHGYYRLSSGPIELPNLLVEGMFANGVPPAYLYSQPGGGNNDGTTDRSGYWGSAPDASSGVASAREPNGGGTSDNYYSQAQGSGGVSVEQSIEDTSEVQAGLPFGIPGVPINWMVDDLFWAVMDLPASYEGT